MGTPAGTGSPTEAPPVHFIVRCSGIAISQNPFTGRATFDAQGVTLRRVLGGARILIPWSTVSEVRLTTSDVAHTKKTSFVAGLVALALFSPRYGGMYGGRGLPEEQVANERVGTLEIHTKSNAVWFLVVHHLQPYQVRQRLSHLLPRL